MNFLLTGAEFNNKGAESMTLVALKYIYDTDSDAKVYVVDYYERKMPFELKKNIEFFDLPFFMLEVLLGRYTVYGIKAAIKDFIKYFVPWKKSHFGKINRTKKLLQSIDVMIDISGFSFSSKWGDADTVEFSNKIYLLKKYGAKIYLMPQSFGPFDYNSPKTLEYGKNAIALCEKVYAREEDGYKKLIELGLNNVEKSVDSVLCERDFDPSLIIKNYNNYREDIKVENKHNIGIVPNYRLIDKGGSEYDDLLGFYFKVIDRLIEKYDFYLIAHAGEDMIICKEIKKRYKNDKRVILIDHVMLSFNYETFTEKLDFIIASRYHSIVHAYKKFTPAVILGWADKYQDIVRLMKQEKFLIDLAFPDKALETINVMTGLYTEERTVIRDILKELQDTSCYSCIGELK